MSADSKIITFPGREATPTVIVPTQLLRYKRTHKKSSQQVLQQFWVATKGPNARKGIWKEIPVAAYDESDYSASYQDLNEGGKKDD